MLPPAVALLPLDAAVLPAGALLPLSVVFLPTPVPLARTEGLLAPVALVRTGVPILGEGAGKGLPCMRERVRLGPWKGLATDDAAAQKVSIVNKSE